MSNITNETNNGYGNNMNTQPLKKANLTDQINGQDWHYSDVIATLHKAGWTLASLGEYHGLTSGGSFSHALRRSLPKAEKRIADAIGIHPKEIWPSRYHPNGERKLQGFHAIQSSKRANRVNGKDAAKNSHEAA